MPDLPSAWLSRIWEVSLRLSNLIELHSTYCSLSVKTTVSLQLFDRCLQTLLTGTGSNFFAPVRTLNRGPVALETDIFPSFKLEKI